MVNNDFRRFETCEDQRPKSSCPFNGWPIIHDNESPRCMQLLPGGTLAPCSQIAYPPDEVLSTSFSNTRRNSDAYFNIMNGNDQKFTKWVSHLPECCSHCVFDKVITHLKQ